MIPKLIAAVVVFAAVGVLFVVKSNQPTGNEAAKVANHSVLEPEFVEGYTEARVLRFTYELSNETNTAIKNAGFYAYTPVGETSNQQVQLVDASTKHTIVEDELNNQKADFNLGLVAPLAKKLVNVSVEITTSDLPLPAELPPALEARYLGEERYVDLSYPPLAALAATLKSEGSSLNTANNIYDWVKENISYAGYVKENRGAKYAFDSRFGDCTEYMYLVVALARLNGIPARGVGGYVYGESQKVDASDYHNWAELYINNRWHVVDAQKEIFSSPASAYNAIRIISDEHAGAMSDRHRFASLTDGLSVRLVD